MEPQSTDEPAPLQQGGIVEQVMVALRRIIRAIDLHSRFLVNRYGLTGPQLAVLKQIPRDGAVSVGKIARGILLTQATVTGILDRLERRNFVRRQRSEVDKRQVLVSLTDAGREVMLAPPSLLHESFAETFGQLQDWEQTLILASLQRLVRMLEAENIEATPMLTTGPVTAAAEQVRALLDAPAIPEAPPSEAGAMGPMDADAAPPPPDAAPQPEPNEATPNPIA